MGVSWLFIFLGMVVLVCLVLLVLLGVVRFCTLVGRFFVLLEQNAEQWSKSCQQAAASFLPQPPTPGEVYRWHEQSEILFALLMYFVLALLFVGGEIYNSLLAYSALSHQPPSQLPGFLNFAGAFELAGSALFLTAPAIFGFVFLEAAGFVDLQEGLFPKLSGWRRVVLSIYSAFFVVVAIVVVYYFWQFRAIYLDPILRKNMNPLVLANMAVFVFKGLGLLAGAGSFIVLRALHIGGKSALVVLLWFASLFFSFLSFGARLVAKLLEWISLRLSGNTLSPYNEPEPRREAPEIVAPHAPLPGGEIMNTEKTGSIVFVEQLGSDLYEYTKEAMRDLRGAKVTLTSGGFHTAAPTKQFVLPGTQSISPNERDIRHVLPYLRGRETADRKGYALLLERMGEHLIEEHRKKGLAIEAAPLLFVLDRRVLADADQMLRNIKKDLRFSAIAVLTAISPEDMQDPIVQEGRDKCQAWWQEGIAETTFVVDPLHAPFCSNQNKQTMYRFWAYAMVSGLVAHTHYCPNLSFVEVLTQLHQSSPFSTISFASAAVDTGTLPGRYKWLPLWLGKKTQKGTKPTQMMLDSGGQHLLE